MKTQHAVGQLVGERYELRALIAEAPAYTEYHAFDREIEVEVSLWWFRDELFPTADQRDQLVTAAFDLRSIGHQNLRKLFDVGRTDRGLYVTVQVCPGVLLRPGEDPPASEDKVLRIATAVSDALEAARSAGHVHGRLTPRDIVHVAGLIKVGGVGLYRSVDRHAAAALWLADEHYIAPEVRAGGAATSAADVYSLGVIVAETAAGMTSPDLAHTMQTVFEQQPGMRTVLDAALSISPDHRPQTPAVLLEMLHVLATETTASDSREHAIPTLERLAVSDPDEDDDPTTAIDVGPPPPGEYSVDEPIAALAPRQRAETRSVVGPQGKPRAADFLHSIAAETIAEDGLIPGEPPPARPATSPPTPMGAPPAPPRAAPAHPVRRPAAVGVPVVEGTPETVMDAGSAGQVRFVSMKPPSEHGMRKRTPIVPVIERHKPKLRPIADAGPPRTKAQPLQYYAPPRPHQVGQAAPKKSLAWLYVIIAALVVSAGVVIVAIAMRDGGGSATSAQDAGPTATEATSKATHTSTPVIRSTVSDAGNVSRCPSRAMVELDSFCIDAYESPGKGRLPETGVSLDQAEASCKKRGRRMCTESEWEAGCRGPDGASFPYGSTARPGACNTFKGGPGEVAPTGAHPECKSAVGAFDMAGNVAEWVEGGGVMGGSVQDGHSGRCSKRSHRRNKDRTFSDVGFRCCVDIAPAP